MKNRTLAIAGVGALVFVIVFGLAAYFYWMSTAYVDTLHARVVASLVEVRSPGAGRVVDLPVEIGDTVAQYEELASLELGGLGAETKVLVPVTAPITGTVVDRPVQVDDVLSAGQSIVVLVDPEHLWVRANIHETKIALVQVGQPVGVRIRSLNRTFSGRVEQIIGATTWALAAGGQVGDVSTPSLVEVPIKISIASDGYILYPGMSAEVRIRLIPRPW